MMRIKGNLKKLDVQDEYNELKSTIRGNIKVKYQEQNEKILLGKYKIEKVLSQGVTKEKYLVSDINDEALHVIRYIQSDTDSYIGIELMEDEGYLKALKHVNLPEIKEMCKDSNSIYIVQNYVEGVMLDNQLKEKGFFSEKEVIKIAIQLCEVFEYLHNCKPHQIIYRYIKPSDILLTLENKIIIVEFGVYEKIIGATSKFAAPEFIKSGYSDCRTDIYSLGSVFYNLLTGTDFVGIQGAFKNSINKHISRRTKKILLKCLEENLSDRYQNISELKAKFKLLQVKMYKKKKIKRILMIIVVIMILVISLLIFLEFTNIYK